MILAQILLTIGYFVAGCILHNRMMPNSSQICGRKFVKLVIWDLNIVSN